MQNLRRWIRKCPSIIFCNDFKMLIYAKSRFFCFWYCKSKVSATDGWGKRWRYLLRRLWRIWKHESSSQVAIIIMCLSQKVQMPHRKCNRGKGRAVQWKCMAVSLSLSSLLSCCAVCSVLRVCVGCVYGTRIGWCEISTRPTRPQKWKKEEIKKPLDWPISSLFFIFIDLTGLIWNISKTKRQESKFLQ